MAKIPNPRKIFQFEIDITGLNNFLAQKVTIPDHEIDIVEHGDTNHLIKTGGIQKYGVITIEKIATAESPDEFLWLWQQEVQQVLLGGGALPSLYKRGVNIRQFSVDGVTIINEWVCDGCWPSKISTSDFSRVDSDNTVETVELCVDTIQHI